VPSGLGVAGTSISPGLVRAAALAGMHMPYAKADTFVDTVTGTRLASASTIARTTRTVGRRASAAAAAEATAATGGHLVDLAAPGPDKCYLVLDGTGAPMLPDQTTGRTGKHRDGRARTREVKIACLFTSCGTDPTTGDPLQDPGSATYLATFAPADTFAEHLRAEHNRRRFAQCRQGVVLGDGARWIWTIADRDWPSYTQIVDWYHATEHIHDLAKLVEPHLDDRPAWTQTLLDQLWAGNTHTITAAVTALDLPDNLTNQATTAAAYFTSNHNRMQYARFTALGLFVGSGTVESACSSIVGQRAKQAGMHWTITGLDPVLQLRALTQSRRDHLIWQPPTTQTTPAQAA